MRVRFSASRVGFNSKQWSRPRLGRAVAPLVEAMELRTLLSGSPLTGSIVGTTGSYHNDGNTITKVFDGNLGNYFDGPAASGNYAELDLGTSKLITQISYAPRVGYGSRMIGGVFQGSDSADFSGAVTTLYTVTTTPASGVFTTVNVSSAVPFRYMRYLSPDNSWGDVGEVQFSGYAPAAGATLSADGTLAVYGTNDADTINVTLNAANGIVTADLNGITSTFTYSAVQRVIVAGLGGDDELDEYYGVASQAAAAPSTLLGGDGDDGIHVDLGIGFMSEPSVFSDGGDGDDSMSVAEDGQATMDGGDGDDGDDKLYAQGVSLLEVSMNGNEGADRLEFDFATSGQMNGGAGDDALHLAGSNSTPVAVNGGDGDDTLFVDYSGTQAAALKLDGQNDSTLGGAPITLGTDIENITALTSEGGLQLFGDAAANVITLTGGYGATVNAGDGNDTIYATDRAHDVIDGGLGTDTAYVDPTGDIVTNVENVVGAIPVANVLTGPVIGTAGSNRNTGNTIAKAFDGNLNDYVDGATANGNYAGLDLGSGEVITVIKYAPRAGYESRMVGGMFQVSSLADFSANVTTLYIITTAPTAGVFTSVSVSDSGSYRYVRYLSPTGSFGNVGELQFIGYAAPTTVGSTLTVQGTGGDDTIGVKFDNDTFAVDINGSTQTYSASGVVNLVVNALDGNNKITIDGSYEYAASTALFANITVNGGSGNDTINTSIQDLAQSSSQSIHVTFNGGEGQDYADVEGGDTATIIDGNGADRFYTQAIQDTLTFTVTAGNGNDHLTVGSVGGSSSQYGTANFGSGLNQLIVTDPDDHLTVNVAGVSVPVTDAYATEIGSVTNQKTGAGVAGVQVFVDANNDGIYTPGEIATNTDANGVFVLSQLPPDASTGLPNQDFIAMTLPAGYSYASTTPTTFAGTFSAGVGYSGLSFVLLPQPGAGLVSGKVRRSPAAARDWLMSPCI